MKQYHKNRLRKLAEHLMKPNDLGHTKFNYGTFGDAYLNQKNGVKTFGRIKLDCKTAGCAVGECPTLFPKYWTFQDDLKEDIEEAHRYNFNAVSLVPRLRASALKNTPHLGELDSEESAEIFFGIPYPVCHVLFFPSNRYLTKSGRSITSPKVGASAKTVGKHIFRVLSLIEDGEIDLSGDGSNHGLTQDIHYSEC